MELESYKLEARGPFHFGQPGIGLESTASFVHSDTLFYAICSATLALYGKTTLEAFLALFGLPNAAEVVEPPFLLSSAFPYYKSLRFYPRPELPDLESQAKPPLEEQASKVLRKAEFVSEKIFTQLLQGQTLERKDSALVQNNKLWVTPDEKKFYDELKLDPQNERAFWKIDSAPHVAVDRITSGSALYYLGRLLFQPGGGLHFLIHWLNPEQLVYDRLTVQTLVEESLRYLSDSGLGGDRASGSGQFVYPATTEKLTLNKSLPGQRYFISLSLYHPRAEEWEAFRDQHQTSYSLLKQDGWITSPGISSIQRRPVWMLGEGAYLAFKEAPSKLTGLGDLVNVTPNWEKVPPEKRPQQTHNIYRYGRALVLPATLKGDV